MPPPCGFLTVTEICLRQLQLLLNHIFFIIKSKYVPALWFNNTFFNKAISKDLRRLALIYNWGRLLHCKFIGQAPEHDVRLKKKIIYGKKHERRSKWLLLCYKSEFKLLICWYLLPRNQLLLQFIMQKYKLEERLKKKEKESVSVSWCNPTKALKNNSI